MWCVCVCVCMCVCVCINIHNGILLGHTRKEILPFAATWMDIEGIMLREITQTVRAKYYRISPTCGIKNEKIKQTSEDNRKADSDTENKLVVSTAGVGEWGVQTGECKTGSRVHYTTWGIDSVYCNNCKWKITFKIALKIKKKKKSRLN